MVKGKVTIDSHGATYPAKTGLRLKTGDTVNSLGGTASILFADGGISEVKEGSRLTVGKGRAEGSRNMLVTRLMDTIRETAHKGRGPTIKGMVRGEREIMLIHPCNSFIHSDDLWFEWGGVEEMGEIKVSLKSPSPVYKFAFRTDPGKKKALLPKEAPPLVPGVRYYWKVKGFEKAEMEPYASKLAWFVVLDSEKMGTLNEEMKKIGDIPHLDNSNRDFLKANLLISYGLYHGAADILKKSLQQFPADTGMKELLKGLFLRMKKFEDAEKLM